MFRWLIAQKSHNQYHAPVIHNFRSDFPNAGILETAGTVLGGSSFLDMIFFAQKNLILT